MKQITGETKVETLLGEVLATPIVVKYVADQFETPQEAKDAGVWPNDASILEGLNSDKERSALASARNKETKEATERITSTVEYRRKTWIADTRKAMPNTPLDVIEAMAAQIQ